MSSKILLCTQCGSQSTPKNSIKGNGFIELILWLCFIVPGLIYSIWRSFSRYKRCPYCKSTNLIPVDSPMARAIIGEKLAYSKNPEYDAEIYTEDDEKSRLGSVFNTPVNKAWFKEHPIKVALILLFVLPLGIRIIANLFGPSAVVQDQTATTQSTPEIPLTQRLKNIDNDPYWASTAVADYSSNTKLHVQSILFSTYADEVMEGEKSTSDEDKKLALSIKNKLIAKQVSEYPKMRKAYANMADEVGWEHDVNASVSGPSNTTLTFVGAIFASNKAIANLEGPIEDRLKELRFKRINYKWIEHDDDYQYFDLKTLNDKDLNPIAIESIGR